MRSSLANYVSNEAISVQNGKLFQDLTDAFAALRGKKDFTTTGIRASGLREIVLAHTGMMVEFSIDPSGYEAYIHWPQLDRNHPFVAEYSKYFLSGSDVGLTLIRNAGGAIKGSVDLKKGKVYGIYTKIQGDIHFGEALMRDTKYSDGELAGIFLHECGHLFTYFEYLGSVVVTSHVMAFAAKSLYTIEDYDERVKILKESERVLGIEILDKERIAAMPKRSRGVVAETIMINANAAKTRSDTGNNIYELRSVEQLADQFATLHGAGRELVTGLDRLYKGFMHSSTLNTAEHTMFEIVKLMLFLGAFLLIPIPLAILLCFYNPTRKYYDDPEARVRLVRQMINDQLKDKSLTNVRRQALLEDIEAIKAVEAQLDDKRSLLQMLWTTIIPSGRAALSQKETMKCLEDLMNNELFTMSAKFKVVTEHRAES